MAYEYMPSAEHFFATISYQNVAHQHTGARWAILKIVGLAVDESSNVESSNSSIFEPYGKYYTQNVNVPRFCSNFGGGMNSGDLQ